MLDKANKREPLTILNLYKPFYCFFACDFFGCELTKKDLTCYKKGTFKQNIVIKCKFNQKYNVTNRSIVLRFTLHFLKIIFNSC